MAFGLFFYALVVTMATLFNQGSGPMALAFLLACLALPRLGGRPAALAATLALRRPGWGLLLALCLVTPLAVYAGLWA